uniref:ABC transporter permease n=1 Tax=Antithamnionella ternifolia TaxID=207919 RepID=A0A4D6WR14_9FLOR|nr:hypothetical protein [Antithamnionella ternifolia]
MFNLFSCINLNKINLENIFNQMEIVGPSSLAINLLTAFFIGMVFSLQIVKEFIYLNAIPMIGGILTISFLRELSPILTAIILIGRVGSCFTAELATMCITEQIDALYILGINPISYLVIPRILASILMLPVLNLLSFTTSLCSSSYLCFIVYNIDPNIFFISVFSSLFLGDIIKSSIKSCIFGLIISLISCSWGLSTNFSTKEVGESIISSVVSSLVIVFILDFILSYFMFSNVDSALKVM